LDSLGQRRIRCLRSLRFTEITGFDLREDRRDNARKRYQIETVERIADIQFEKIGAIIISTPPDKHNAYIRLAIDKGKPAFVEASMILHGLHELNQLAKDNNVFVAPSCTMKFHPAIEKIKEILQSEQYGKVKDFCYYSGKYLPDWHPWEDIRQFFVSKKETGGCREIVPLELTWIVDLFGFPTAINGFYGKTTDFGVDIDDTYVLSLNFGDVYGNVTVDVVSRCGLRHLILNMERGHMTWR
jgi:predicted dehydrogenase